VRGALLISILGGCHYVLGLDQSPDASVVDAIDAGPDAPFDPVACPVGYIALPGLPNSKYKFVLADDQYADHDNRCRLDGTAAHLVLIETVTEGFAIDEQLDLLGLDEYFWVGVTQDADAQEPSEGWTWLSGRELEADLWFVNEPRDGSDAVENHEEDHGMIARFGSSGNQIIDAPAGSTHHAICECDGVTLAR